MSYLMTLWKKFILIWPESVKINFMRILLRHNWQREKIGGGGGGGKNPTSSRFR